MAAEVSFLPAWRARTLLPGRRPLPHARTLGGLLALGALFSACQTTAREPRTASGQLDLTRRSGVGAPETDMSGGDALIEPRLYPGGSWLPVHGPVLSSLTVDVRAGGHTVQALLDTGAEYTVLSPALAEKLGVVPIAGAPLHGLDAHGTAFTLRDGILPVLHIGGIELRNIRVRVGGVDAALFLVGANVLVHLELYLALDRGVVGVFPAGKGPRAADDAVLPLEPLRGLRTVRGEADAAHGTVPLAFLLDTGASATGVALLTGLNAGLPTDLRFVNRMMGAASAHEHRGVFALPALSMHGVGDTRHNVGPVFALGAVRDGADGSGLLGLDVLGRQRTLIAMGKNEVRMRPWPARGSTRSDGPNRRTCRADGARVPCVAVALKPGAGEQVCLDVRVDPVFAGHSMLVIADHYDAQGGALAGGALSSVYFTVPAEGWHQCVPMPAGMQTLGVTAASGTRLVRVAVDTPGWPCGAERTACAITSGVLPKREAAGRP